MWNQLCVFGTIALTKILKCNSDMGIWEGICSNMSWRAGFCKFFHGRTEPCPVQEAPTQWGLGSLSVQQFYVSGRKGLCIPGKEKLFFCSVRVYLQLSLLSVWVKGNGNINLSMIKKNKIEREQIDKSLAWLKEWKLLYVEKMEKNCIVNGYDEHKRRQ